VVSCWLDWILTFPIVKTNPPAALSSSASVNTRCSEDFSFALCPNRPAPVIGTFRRGAMSNWDRVGIEFNTNAEAIKYCKEMAQDFRDNSLRDDQNLEISVVNEVGREIYRQFVHREAE
jgi:hypothetical protein